MSLTYGVVLSVSRQVMQKTVRDGLIETVESNVGDIEYYDSLDEMKLADDGIKRLSGPVNKTGSDTFSIAWAEWC